MLKQKRKEIIEYIKEHRQFLASNHQALDIYEGNLLPYVHDIMRSSLSANYYHSIKDRILPINILQRYIDKVSTTYSKPPIRSSDNQKSLEFVEFYSNTFHINNSGQLADVYSNLFKGFAWEPYIDKSGIPALREIPYNSFLVMSESMVNPEEETIFIKFMGKKTKEEDSLLLFVYTDEEFDAFYMSGEEASEFLVDNQGVNVIGTIPFVYGKRQKNRLIPVIDTDMLSIAKALPCLISDGAGAQMYQAFSIIYGVDISTENLKMSPNALWSIKSDRESDKNPQLGVLTPTAQTDKIMEFVSTTFSLWLETKGVRVGSVGSANGSNLSSGISKIIDEMDVWELKKKSQYWFKKDEEELWNEKMPKIHNYWIKSGLLNPAMIPPMMPENQDPEIYVEFEAPRPMISRTEEISQIKAELELGTMTLEQAVKKLHPDMDDDDIAKTLSNRALI
jgi:hypothetical protein